MEKSHVHTWKPNKDPQVDNLVCECGAIGFKDKNKDPFNETEGSAIFLIKPATQAWERMTIRGRSKWYQERQAMIQEDIQKMGKHLARLKWDVPIGTWSRMVTGLRSSTKATRKVPAGGYIGKRPAYLEDLPSQLIELPRLPEWRDDWSEPVQTLWLHNYRALAIVKALGI